MRHFDNGQRRYPPPVSAFAGVMLDGWPSTSTGQTRGVGPWADQPSDAPMSCDRVACRHEAGSFVPRTNLRLPATADLPPRGRHCGQGLGDRLMNHPVVVRTAACGRRLGGGPPHNGPVTEPIGAPERTEDTKPRHISRPRLLRAYRCVPSSLHVRPCITGPRSPT